MIHIISAYLKVSYEWRLHNTYNSNTLAMYLQIPEALRIQQEYLCFQLRWGRFCSAATNVN